MKDGQDLRKYSKAVFLTLKSSEAGEESRELPLKHDTFKGECAT